MLQYLSGLYFYTDLEFGIKKPFFFLTYTISRHLFCHLSGCAGKRERQAQGLKITIDNACDGRIKPNFVLFISGKVSLQWLDIQKNEEIFLLLAFTTWSYKSVSGKTAY